MNLLHFLYDFLRKNLYTTDFIKYFSNEMKTDKSSLDKYIQESLSPYLNKIGMFFAKIEQLED